MLHYCILLVRCVLHYCSSFKPGLFDVCDVIPPHALHRVTKVRLVTPEVMEDQEIR